MDIAKAHWARYPAMEPQDFAKLAYQSAFGPAHMVPGPDRVLAALLAERKEAGVEPLARNPSGTACAASTLPRPSPPCGSFRWLGGCSPGRQP